eukprot:9137801-Pyramimonas_sp.AAC.1
MSLAKNPDMLKTTTELAIQVEPWTTCVESLDHYFALLLLLLLLLLPPPLPPLLPLPLLLH